MSGYFTKKFADTLFSKIEESIKNAKEELSKKSIEEIQVATAITWLGRAVASVESNPNDAKEYAHEAIEHAALSEDDNLLKTVRKVLKDNKVEI